MLKINSFTNYTNYNTHKQKVNRAFTASQGSLASEKPNSNQNQKKTSKYDGVFYLLGLAVLGFFVFSNKNTPKEISSHIDFKPSETFKEAVAFARKKLDISKYEGFNEEKHLSLVNGLNKKFVEISNKKYGTASLPKGVLLSADGFKPQQTATIIKNTGTKYDGWLCINKNEIDNIDTFLNGQELDFSAKKLNKKYEKTLENISYFIINLDSPIL